MATKEHMLTPDEIKRNKHGPMFQYDFCDKDQGPLEACYGLSRIEHMLCQETEIYRKEVFK